jgi:hypothetical protein
MDIDAAVGLVIVALALSTTLFLVFLSRSIIERIHHGKPKSLRQILRKDKSES